MAEAKKSHDGLHLALIAAQGKIGTAITKDERANTGKFAYGYASLPKVLETITPALHENGLVCFQTLDLTERGDTVLVTTIVHAETGDSIGSRYPVRCAEPNDPQKVGGAVTYARRYSLLAMLGLAAEDDDGASAGQAAKTAQKPAQGAGRPRGPQTEGEWDYENLEVPARRTNVLPDGVGGDQTVTPKQLKFIQAIAREAGLDEEALEEEVERTYQRPLSELGRRDASAFIERLQARRNTVGDLFEPPPGPAGGEQPALIAVDPADLRKRIEAATTEGDLQALFADLTAAKAGRDLWDRYGSKARAINAAS